MEHSFAWEVIKFILTVVVIPFCVWTVRTTSNLKDSVSKTKEELLTFKEQVAREYAPKEEVSKFVDHIDIKITNMQNAVTQRIDTMQSNIATMIATLSKGKD